ncbi:probable U3 small nucleolar RNA-associated protein 11 isoform X2 [Bemisia tabaci]|nr:PREDICTED: probable U3 small nucleolar RNA-associated protein 11 isoform X2 [Bemisia tabaci]
MSSWKKVAKLRQTPHRERHQPEERSNLGLLHKQKDYQARAKNANEKKRALKLLHRKALDKNPDEFYFHMINSKVQDGEHIEFSKDNEYTDEQIKLMQTRDIKYINMQRTIEHKKVNRLKREMHLLDAAERIPNHHLFFIDDDKERKNFDPVKHLGTHPDLLGRKTNRPRLLNLNAVNLPDMNIEAVKAAAKVRNKKYSVLNRHMVREKQLSIVQRKLELKRHLLSQKGVKKERIQPAAKDAPPVYKWKFQRKR